MAVAMSHELQLLIFAVILTALTVLVHGFGMFLAMHRFEVRWPELSRHMTIFRGQWLMLRLVFLVLTFHFCEAVMWGVGIHMLRIFPDFETAIYFAASTYTTVGYGDIVLPEPWRLLGPLEAMLGMLMFGWSTGVLVAIVMRIYEHGRRGRVLGPDR